MMDSFLAQGFDVEGWVEIIVLVLVFGGSILSAVAKKLIEKFSTKEDGLKGAGKSPAGSLQPPPPRPPVSREPLPVGRASPPRPTVPRARPVAAPSARPPERRATEWVIEELTEAPPSQPIKRECDAQQTRAPKKKRGQSRRDNDAVKGSLAHLAPAPGKRVDHLHSHLEHDGVDMDDDVEKRLGHFESELEVQEKEVVLSDSSSRFPHPTRSVLRNAIILSEILSPPLALRDPDEGV